MPRCLPHFFRIQCVAFVVALCSSLPQLAAQAPQITGFAPAKAAPGSVVEIQGNHLSETEAVFFFDEKLTPVPAAFSSGTNGELLVTVPEISLTHLLPEPVSKIMVITAEGATVTLPATTKEVTGTEVRVPMVRFYRVVDGGVFVDVSGGTAVIVVESGGAALIAPGGLKAVFADNLATIGFTDQISPWHTFVTSPLSLFQDLEEPPAQALPTPGVKASIVPALFEIARLPRITSPETAHGMIGEPFSFLVTTDRPDDPTLTFSASGLPDGLSMESTTGLISGTPSAPGSFQVELSVDQEYGTTATTLLIHIASTGAPIPSYLPPVVATSGVELEIQLVASGAPESFDIVDLPPGLALDAETGLITGSPTEAGIYPLHYSASNASGTGFAQVLVLVDHQQPLIESVSHHMAGIGETVTLQGSGFSPVTQAWFLDMLWGAYEVVITVVSDELIELTVPELDFFSFHPQNALIVLKGPAGATVTLAQSTTIITEEGLDEILSQRDYYVQQGAVLDASRSRLRVYLESGASASLTGQNPTVFAETGSSLSVTNPGFGSRFFLAPGLTPPVSPFATIIESVPAIQPSWLPTLLWVTPQLTVSIDPPPEAILGLPYFHQITYSASAPATVTYTAEGLPPGLTIHETTGHITGTPSQAGLFHFTVEVEHQFGVSLGQYSLRVVDLGIPFLQTPSAVAVPLLTAFEYIVPVSPAAEWFSAENLPPGLELNPITGVIAGSATTPGIYEVLLEAGNPHGKTEAKVNFMVETIPPKITRLPQHASIGSVIEVEGEGFATTSAVYISSQVTRMVPAEFEVVSDQILYVTIPEIQLFPPFLTFIKLTVVAESGATVTLFQDGLFYEVTSSMPISSGRTYLVRDGGILTDLTQGTSDFYLETGGSLHASMIRFSALYLEDGAVANITDPSFNTVIHTPNAVMSIADGFEMTFIEVPVLQPSMVPNYVNLAQVPSITSPRTTSGFFRMPFVYSVAVDISATAFEAEDLPDGLTLDPETGIISGRAQQQGSFSVRLKAINENGFGEATLALTIVDPYDFWREETFAALPGGAAHPLAASTADANQDGFENLLQFALGRDPLGSNDPSTLPVLGVQVGGAAPVSGGEVLAGIAGDPPSALTYSFRRRTGDGLGDTESGYTIGRVTYFVMVSHDLDSWHTGPDWLTQSGDPVENGDGTETVTVMLNATPIDPVFVKLKVVEE